MGGQWIGCETCEAPLIAGEFYLEETCKLSINICGLGFFELYINGKKVSEDLFVPVWSDYSSRNGQRLKYPINDQRSYQVYYCTYDLSEYVQKGKNTIEVLLGNGWYNQTMRMAEGEMWYGLPKLWFEMFRDGEAFVSSGTWLKWRPSYIVSNNVYFGEAQDFSAEEQDWKAVEQVEAPEGELKPQQCPADRVIREIVPTYLCEKDGRKVYDAGENITGWAVFTECGAKGDKITLRYAEEVYPDGELNFESTGTLKQVQSDSFVSAGKKDLCVPHFTWHGFRYFDVEGPVENLRVQVVHSDVDVTGSFRCSDENINWMVEAYIRSRLGNMHCGVPSDCPHRERLGYTGDTQAICGTDFWMLDADLFYRKWMDDVAAGQCRISGHVQHTAPVYGGGGGPGGWGGAMVLVPWEHYRRYGDKKVLEQYYPNMCNYIRYMYSRCDETGLVVREEERGWCLGDWCAPERVDLPTTLVNTYYLVRCLMIVREVAEILGCECPYTAEDVAKTKQSLIDNFYKEENNHFFDGIQGADAFALDIGLGNQEMAAEMAKCYQENPAFDTGFLGTGILIRQLFNQGDGETAITLLKSEAEGTSYGWQRKQGATTLWERWNGHESHNHPMFGSPIQMLFEGLLGIQSEDGLKIEPLLTKQLDWVEASADTKFGKIKIKWSREGEKVTLEVDAPCEAELILKNEKLNVKAGANQCYIV